MNNKQQTCDRTWSLKNTVIDSDKLEWLFFKQYHFERFDMRKFHEDFPQQMFIYSRESIELLYTSMPNREYFIPLGNNFFSKGRNIARHIPSFWFHSFWKKTVHWSRFVSMFFCQLPQHFVKFFLQINPLKPFEWMGFNNEYGRQDTSAFSSIERSISLPPGVVTNLENFVWGRISGVAASHLFRQQFWSPREFPIQWTFKLIGNVTSVGWDHVSVWSFFEVLLRVFWHRRVSYVRTMPSIL